MIREEINNSMSINKITKLMSEGDYRAKNVILQIFDSIGKKKGLDYLSILDDMNIRGKQILTAYQDYCGENLDLFLEAVSIKDEDMTLAINIQTAKCCGKDENNRPKAVTGGARVKRENLSEYDVGLLRCMDTPKNPDVRSEDYDF